MKKRHEVTLVIRTDKPCTKTQAVAMVKDSILGVYYPDPGASDVGTFRIVTVKPGIKRKPRTETVCDGCPKVIQANEMRWHDEINGDILCASCGYRRMARV